MNENNLYAVASIIGDITAPNLKGTAYFKPFRDGVMVELEVSGLPVRNNYELFPVSIYDSKNCDISISGIFNNIGSSFNPSSKKHPLMEGDMPYLFSNNDYAYLKFYTTRFKIYDVIGKLIVIHEPLNDFNSNIYGRKIGCGKIVKLT